MNILHVSDLHFRQPWYHWLRNQAPPHDVLVISGDLLDQRMSDVAGQIKWVSDWLRASPVPVVACSGSHDLQWDPVPGCWRPAYWLRELAAPPVYPDGAVLERNGLSFAPIACTQRPRNATADCWVVHTPPAGTATARTSAGVDRGDSALNATVARRAPAYVFSGQVHDAEKWHDTVGATWVLNPGANPHGRFPNHILLNGETGEARRISDRLQGGYSERAMTPGMLVLG